MKKHSAHILLITSIICILLVLFTSLDKFSIALMCIATLPYVIFNFKDKNFVYLLAFLFYGWVTFYIWPLIIGIKETKEFSQK